MNVESKGKVNVSLRVIGQVPAKLFAVAKPVTPVKCAEGSEGEVLFEKVQQCDGEVLVKDLRKAGYQLIDVKRHSERRVNDKTNHADVVWTFTFVFSLDGEQPLHGNAILALLDYFEKGYRMAKGFRNTIGNNHGVSFCGCVARFDGKTGEAVVTTKVLDVDGKPTRLVLR